MRTTSLTIALALGLAACSGPAEDAKDLVREELIDGGSAKFENVVVDSSANRVCGWVNAKNRMGGYVGAERFVVEDGRVISLGSRVDEGAEGAFGSCVALNRAASERLTRDVYRAVRNYDEAAMAQ